jgi:hypothetical protein
MNKYRVWIGSSTLKSGNYQDIIGKSMESVMRKVFGFSQKLVLLGSLDNTYSVGKSQKTGGYSIQGYIRDLGAI